MPRGYQPLLNHCVSDEFGIVPLLRRCIGIQERKGILDLVFGHQTAFAEKLQKMIRVHAVNLNNRKYRQITPFCPLFFREKTVPP